MSNTSSNLKFIIYMYIHILYLYIFAFNKANNEPKHNFKHQIFHSSLD